MISQRCVATIRAAALHQDLVLPLNQLKHQPISLLQQGFSAHPAHPLSFLRMHGVCASVFPFAHHHRPNLWTLRFLWLRSFYEEHASPLACRSPRSLPHRRFHPVLSSLLFCEGPVCVSVFLQMHPRSWLRQPPPPFLAYQRCLHLLQQQFCVYAGVWVSLLLYPVRLRLQRLGHRHHPKNGVRPYRPCRPYFPECFESRPDPRDFPGRACRAAAVCAWACLDLHPHE